VRYDVADHERMLALVSPQLNDAVLASAWDAGECMTVVYALAD
jgi:hypothetical protein